ncbi:MAG: hypothetical protein A2832_00855 [Candidatus Zambryskibacteria bacterium RIFCSPHIGHO2_01_FULL_44_22b]|uniref:Uncharacterized protein n=2 Tax=Candidatus Zambryskiibacteriota TaxID=1817925 RepID=A0A1G2T144_9BACT|nr:MAG: hypothetical protein A2832_00855 [Candidatus Zambryskibacteria bacterium RIFCSPHIGHO2_01_FULL_44_22b]OHB04522.1 MAG: hypothetical protein A3B16_03060 [Candidatus Zambryskibacteria bacterium RIFCSPLOWO2_01_FULL_45_43]
MTTKTTKKPISPLALEEAKDAVTKLKSIKPFLTPADEETLGILIDKELVSNLSKSLIEAKLGKYEPVL